jgi:hypothetical protein
MSEGILLFIALGLFAEWLCLFALFADEPE